MNEMKMILFRLENSTFGFSIDQVLSIEKLQPFTKLPNSKEYIRGVINLRGNVIPVIDLRTFLLGHSVNGDREENRIIVANVDEHIMGFIVDEATDVQDISEQMVQHVELKNDQNNQTLKIARLDDRLIILLDVNNLLMKNELVHALNELRNTAY